MVEEAGSVGTEGNAQSLCQLWEVQRLVRPSHENYPCSKADFCDVQHPALRVHCFTTPMSRQVGCPLTTVSCFDYTKDSDDVWCFASPQSILLPQCRKLVALPRTLDFELPMLSVTVTCGKRLHW